MTLHGSLRADRLATLYFFHPLRILVRERSPSAAILMYHSVARDTADPSIHPYFQTRIDPEKFAVHMQFLSDEGYAVIPLREISAVLNSSDATPGKAVALTFDDGFKDFIRNVFPILKEKGYPASVFVSTGYVGGVFKQKECLSWSDIRQLADGGIEIGSHTVTHPKLHGMPEAEIESEIRTSKRELEEKIGRVVDTFSYPFAFPQEDSAYIGRLRGILLRNGYRTGVTTGIGRVVPGQDPLFLRRIPLNNHDDHRLFQAKLEGGYDWLRGMQYLSRIMRGWF